MIGRRGVPQKFRGAKDARHDAPTSLSRISGKCENVAVFLYKNFNRYLHSNTNTRVEAKRLEFSIVRREIRENVFRQVVDVLDFWNISLDFLTDQRSSIVVREKYISTV